MSSVMKTASRARHNKNRSANTAKAHTHSFTVYKELLSKTWNSRKYRLSQRWRKSKAAISGLFILFVFLLEIVDRLVCIKSAALTTVHWTPESLVGWYINNQTSANTHTPSLFYTAVSKGRNKMTQTNTGVLLGHGRWAISRTSRIISACSGRWQEISLQVTKTVSVNWSSSVTSNRAEDGLKPREKGRGGGELTDGTVMKIGGKIMSLVVSSSRSACLIIQSNWLERGFTVCCLLKNPERLQLSSSAPPSFSSLHQTAGTFSSHPFLPPPPRSVWTTSFLAWFFIPRSSHLFIFFLPNHPVERGGEAGMRMRRKTSHL